MVLSKKHAQETNWKQKFQKLQNENICLTNLNVANNGNFPILAFGDCCDKAQKKEINMTRHHKVDLCCFTNIEGIFR